MAHELPEPYEATRQMLLEKDRPAFARWDPPATEKDICSDECAESYTRYIQRECAR